MTFTPIPAPDNVYALFRGKLDNGQLHTWWIPVIRIHVHDDGRALHIVGAEATTDTYGNVSAEVVAETLKTFLGTARVPPIERPGGTKQYYTPKLFAQDAPEEKK